MATDMPCKNGLQQEMVDCSGIVPSGVGLGYPYFRQVLRSGVSLHRFRNSKTDSKVMPSVQMNSENQQFDIW